MCVQSLFYLLRKSSRIILGFLIKLPQPGALFTLLFYIIKKKCKSVVHFNYTIQKYFPCLEWQIQSSESLVIERFTTESRYLPVIIVSKAIY